MNPITFPQVTNTLAKNQPEFRVLPVCIKQPDPDVPYMNFTCKYELSDLEIQQVIATKSIYFTQSGMVFQPILPQVENAFWVCTIQYKETEPGIYTFWIPMNDGSVTELNGVALIDVMSECCRVTLMPTENLHFVERSEIGVDGDGNIVSL